MSDDFKKPLDQYIDEHVEVERPTADYNPRTKTIENFRMEKVKVSVPTRYTKSSQYASICPNRQHSWHMIDKHRHIAACKQCVKRRFIHVAYECINSEGHLVDRDSGIRLD